MALGMIEVYGFATSIVVADAAAKAGNVKIVAIENNKPAPAVVDTIAVRFGNVRLEGDVAAVEAAVEAGSAAARTTRSLYYFTCDFPFENLTPINWLLKNTLGRDKLYKHNKENKIKDLYNKSNFRKDLNIMVKL